MPDQNEKMVSVIYKGPSKFVRVAPYGEHYKNTVVEYPESFANELVESSQKQNFKLTKPAGKSKDEK